jgi:hypothetical protein
VNHANISSVSDLIDDADESEEDIEVIKAQNQFLYAKKQLEEARRAAMEAEEATITKLRQKKKNNIRQQTRRDKGKGKA